MFSAEKTLPVITSSIDSRRAHSVHLYCTGDVLTINQIALLVEVVTHSEVDRVLLGGCTFLVVLVLRLEDDVFMWPEVHTDVDLFFLAVGGITGLIVPLV